MLTYIVADSAEELKELLGKLTPTPEIISIYGMDHRHWAWIKLGFLNEKKKGNK